VLDNGRCVDQRGSPDKGFRVHNHAGHGNHAVAQGRAGGNYGRGIDQDGQRNAAAAGIRGDGEASHIVADGDEQLRGVRPVVEQLALTIRQDRNSKDFVA